MKIVSLTTNNMTGKTCHLIIAREAIKGTNETLLAREVLTELLASESIMKSVIICVDDIILLWLSACMLYKVRISTPMFLLHETEGIYCSVRVLHISWQLKCSTCLSWFIYNGKQLNSFSSKCSGIQFLLPFFYM